MTKKVVTYDSSKGVLFLDKRNSYHGGKAIVFTLDHPDSDFVSNTSEVLTSRVIRVMADGEFETVNTIYIPSVRQSFFDKVQ